MTPIGPEKHVRTADLLRFVDGEGNAAFRNRVTAHLAGCADCSAAAERMRVDNARLLDRLNVLDDATAFAKLPATFAEIARRRVDRPRQFDWRRAAVIVLFLGAGGAVARPAAAWLNRLINSDKAPSNDVAAVHQTPAKHALVPVDTTSAAYSFAPASNELRIDFASAEPGGELAVRAYDENSASFELQSTVALPPVLILPNGVRVTNETNRGTRYTLALPRNVDVLIVTVAGHSPQRIVAGSLPARVHLND